jgi:hypothetical protein
MSGAEEVCCAKAVDAAPDATSNSNTKPDVSDVILDMHVLLKVRLKPDTTIDHDLPDQPDRPDLL